MCIDPSVILHEIKNMFVDAEPKDVQGSTQFLLVGWLVSYHKQHCCEIAAHILSKTWNKKIQKKQSSRLKKIKNSIDKLHNSHNINFK